jgi:hypothetical protein
MRRRNASVRFWIWLDYGNDLRTPAWNVSLFLELSTDLGPGNRG